MRACNLSSDTVGCYRCTKETLGGRCGTFVVPVPEICVLQATAAKWRH